MKTTTLLCAGFAIVLPLSLTVAPALAQSLTTFVSGAGSDANNTCGDPATPCRTLRQALANTFGGGEVICVAGGHFDDSIPITHSVTIDCGGSVGLSAGSLTIDGAGIVVKLRNLTINSGGIGFIAGFAQGINAVNMAALFIEHCHILGFQNGTPGIGIRFAPFPGVSAQLHVSDSVITNNGLPSSGGGIVVEPSGSGSARVVIERTRLENNTYGVFANGMNSTGLIAVQIKDSTVANSAFNGISAFTAAGRSTTSVVVDRSSSLLNGAAGISAQGPTGFVTLSETTVMSNGLGLQTVNGGSIFSYQNNRLTGNVSDGAPTAMLAVK